MAVLELANVAKHYGAITALTDISLTLNGGEVVGLVGDNGAGKTTLVKIIAGNFHPSEGSISLDGQAVQLHGPKDARSKGIEIVYQDLALADNLTAAANIFLGRELTTIARTPAEAEQPFWQRRRGWRLFVPEILDYRGMYKKAGELFAELKSETRPRDLVRRMSGGQRQAVAIARTRLSNPKIVLMDEPTAAISVRQVAEVLNLIRRLKEQGIAVILISHRIPDVFAVCDRLVVLRRGRKVADKLVADSSPEEVTGLITGALQSA